VGAEADGLLFGGGSGGVDVVVWVGMLDDVGGLEG